MENNKLWIKLFEAGGKIYCYDISTNNIMEVDEIMRYVLEHYGGSVSKNEIRRNTQNTFPVDKQNEAFAQIESYRESHGGFRPKKNLRLNFPFSKEEYKKLTDNLVRHVILNITEDCNFRCSYCKFTGGFDYSRRHSERSMPWEVVKKSIDFLVNGANYYLNGTDHDIVLGFYGGEPLLEANKIFDAIEYVKHEYSDLFPRFRYSLTTNCSCLTEPIIHKLIEYDTSLLLSLDGPKELNDRYRLTQSRSGSFEIIQEAINRIKKIDSEFFRTRVGFSTVCSPEYRLREVIDYFRNYFSEGNRVFRISSVNIYDTDFFEKFDLEAERKELLKDEVDLQEEYIQKKIRGEYDGVLSSIFDQGLNRIHKRYVFETPEEIFPNGICLPGLQRILVDTEGNFHVCEKIEWNRPIGNLEDGFDIDSIYSLIYQYIDSTGGDCSDCWAVRFCSDCYMSAIDGADFSRQVKEKKCRSTRNNVLKDMQAYVRIMEKNPQAFSMKREDDRDNVMQEAFKFLGRI
jgi:uncharacterized protein